MTHDYELLKRLCETDGIPGREEAVRGVVREALGDLAAGARVDAMGNLIVEFDGPADAPLVMVSAHMDEIGFVVRHVDDKGFLRLQNHGGFDVRNLFARHVRVHTRRGGPRMGVLNPGVKPVHIATPEDRKKIPELDEFVVDLGLPAETVKAEVRVGDMVTLVQPFVDLGDVVSGKAMDDRSGCWVLIESLRRLASPAVRVAAVFSTQEEVGLRGAITSAFAVQPDVGIALDTTLAVDTPGTPEHLAVTRLGQGVAIKVRDSSTISQPWLVDALADLAVAQGIAHQFEVLPLGGTDAGAIQRSRGGVASVTLSNPSRYVHTVVEMLAKRDLEAAVALLTAFLSTPGAAVAPAETPFPAEAPTPGA
ncbi:MAG: M42 family metallopeptidase [Trueperaceae bacterium]